MGDRLLHMTHPLHGRVMNSGVGGAEDVCSQDQILAAADAFDYLGLTDLAHLVRRIPCSDFGDGREGRMNRGYFGLVQTDMLLWAAVVRKYEAAPQDFDPLPTEPPPPSPLPELPAPTRPVEHVTCAGLLTVHELTTVCAEDATCQWRVRPVEHSWAVLHRGVDCDLCPYGPDWAD